MPVPSKISFNLLTALLLFIAFRPARAQEKTGINFAASSWEQVLHTAKREGKAIFLYASTPGCRYCRQMEKEVFPMAAVSDFYNTRFVSFQINMEDKGEGEALAKKYGITSFPSYLYFDQEAELLHQSGAGKSAEEFIEDGKNALNPEKALFTLKKRYDTGERSPSFLLQYSQALGFYRQADSPEEKVVEEYLATQTPPQLESEENLNFIFSRYLAFHSPATQYLLQNQQKFSPLFKEEEVKRRAERIITRTAQAAGSENNLVLLKDVQQAAAANFKEAERLAALTMIYFYAGQQDWHRYAKETLAYSKSKAVNDWRTLYETGMYLNAFAKEKETLKMGVQIMKKVLKLHRDPENLSLYAQLLHATGKNQSAYKAAKAAVEAANATGEDARQAQALLTELKQTLKK
ncbi:thioredoxin family protein [Rufibacter glacialis]|nr:thioredoxin family protein [Rufibacter glacialis]